ncbi:unnamed protein product [Clonostachys rosea]|uniref:F-box domain-containing protein n=1 Tax=Bionectria ochroleuca TaxID=29856 RepID=A0ABY6TSS2_BIOOC|nr:unnamed protein product [Clonostachys rosea]
MQPSAAALSSVEAGQASRPMSASEEQEDSRSTSSTTNSPVPADNEESDFFLNNNDSESSIGVHNFQDMVVDDSCWPPVNQLPNEILISIFAKLTSPNDLFSCMRVCKRWARNAVDILWHRPACTNWKNHNSICQTLSFDKPFFNYADFIKRLNLAALADQVNDGSVLPLAVCTRVERLTLTACRNLTDSGLIALVQNSSALLALDISSDTNITEKSINAIADNCKRLQGLNVSGCTNISNESMINLAKNCKYIKRLKLNECTQLRDDAILAFAANCPNILEIDLQQCAAIGNSPVTSLLTHGNCLRELRLANCEMIDDNAFHYLPKDRVFEHLRILDLTSCQRLTDHAVSKIIDAAPRLRNLILAKCRLITDEAVYAIAKLGKNLHYIHLGHCGLISDDGVKKLAHKCNRIRYIDLGCCTRLTDDSVKRLALLPKLKRIGLVKCNSITDDSVNALAGAAYRPVLRRDANGVLVHGEYYTPSLERVHLSYCVNLTLKSIIRLLNSCPRLTHLSLTGVAAFQRDEFQPFCRPAPQEFTQHQRNVFCVFSGNMVSDFRRFLNTAPQFEELRNSLQPVADRLRTPRMRRRPVPNGVQVEGETFDDDLADDDNDFEGLDANEMVVDLHTAPMLTADEFNENEGVIALPPPPLPFHRPPPPAQQNHDGGAGSGSGDAADEDQPRPQAFSSFLNSQQAVGSPPLSAYGTTQASVANVRSQREGEPSNRNITPNGGASTAPMHGQPQAQNGAEDEEMTAE